MTDVFDTELRKKVMSSIGSKNSKAELLVFSYLRSQNIYFQKHYKKALGTPDIALPRKKIAVFIDGDFWHGRRLTETLRKRGLNDFWTQKIINNVSRDVRQRSDLAEKGWSVLSVWETDLLRKRTRHEEFNKIKDFLLIN